jgi:hypothetical protein
MARTDAHGTSSQARAVPPIDLDVPTWLQTATFAIG